MKTSIKNLLFLLCFAVTTYLIGVEMKKWMSSQEVVAFEFIKNEKNAATLLNSADWQTPDANGRTKVEKMRINTRIDFLYIISYVALFIFLARALLGVNHPKTIKMTSILFIIGGADVLENLCLLQILNQQLGFYPAIMYGLAALKFGLLFLIVAWLILSTAQKLLKNK